MSYFVYILYSQPHRRYYIGQTSDIQKRIARHNAGIEQATAPYRPWVLALSLQKQSRGAAMILERKLKNLNTDDLITFIIKYGGIPGAAR